MGPGETSPHSAALRRPWTPDSDPEIEDFLRDTPEACTSSFCSPTLDRPLSPGAARRTIEAANEPAVNVEAVVEGLLPWLKGDTSSSESSYTRNPSPDIELGEIFQFEEAAQLDRS